MPHDPYMKHMKQNMPAGIDEGKAMPWDFMSGQPWFRMFAVLLIAMLGLRLLAMAFVTLIPEEAYYWMYSQHPALSYFDHPPMISWTIGLGTTIFGDTEFGVRIMGHLLMLGASFLMYRFGRAWFSPQAGLLSAMLLQILPVYFGAGFIATMDSALLFFWMLCLVGLTDALRENRWWGWYIAGVALGLALLTKYTGIFLAGGTGLAMLVHRPWRRHFLTVHPYVAFLLAAMLFSPVIIWNAQHDWASFRFQFMDRWDGEALSLLDILTFFEMQILILTPVLFWAGCLFVSHLPRNRTLLTTPHALMGLFFSAPLLMIMAHKSLRYGVHINWTLPAYLSILPAFAQWLMTGENNQENPGKHPGMWRQGLKWTLMLCVVVNLAAASYLLILQPRLQWISAFGPWEALSQVVEEYEDQIEQVSGCEPLIAAKGKYQLASVLAFYRKPLEHDVNSAYYTTSQWVFGGNGLGYPYWADPDKWRGCDLLYLYTHDSDEDILESLDPYFRKVELIKDERLLTIAPQPYRLAIGRFLDLEFDL